MELDRLREDVGMADCCGWCSVMVVLGFGPLVLQSSHVLSQEDKGYDMGSCLACWKLSIVPQAVLIIHMLVTLCSVPVMFFSK